ncbi:Vps62-related protein [Streptomyces sp. NPDC098077]|uniref:Vps62-related protein n=1 Tax=Streptomyces sp. NPDC098077 TaxID=3366093 RepID=UPI00382C1CDB
MPESVRYGALEIMVVDQFHQAWWDKGSGADRYGSFHNPNINLILWMQGWRFVGTVGKNNWGDISGTRATILVRGVDAADAMVKAPTGWERIWHDKDTDSLEYGSVWRPQAPSGYVALGDVWTEGWGEPDDGYAYGCIRKELAGRPYVREGETGDLIWNDKGSEGSYDVSCWEIRPAGYPDNTERLILGADLLRAHDGYDRPVDKVHVLDLPPVIVKREPPAAPVLTSHQAPKETDQVTDRAVLVPCTVIKDPGKTVAWQVTNSPFYTLERRLSFHPHKHFDNSQGSTEESAPQTVTTGVSKTKSDEFSERTSITVTAHAGIELKGFSAGIETSVATELGYTSRREVSQFEEVTDTWPLTIPAGKSAAIWSPRHELVAVRSNGDAVGGQGGLVFDVNSRIKTEYPAPAQEPGSLSEAIEAGDSAPFGKHESNVPAGL